MLHVAPAADTDIDDLVELEAALFREDAGVHDPHADVTWPDREGRTDFTRLLATDDALVLRAQLGDETIGLLVGYSTPASATRQPVTYAIIRSLYVAPDARRSGAATLLVERFVEWARTKGCAEVGVDHYAANEAAAAFYERCGFAVRSVSRVSPL